MATIYPVFKDTSARWDMDVEFDKVPYKLHVWWNSREDAWYVDLLDPSSNVLAGNMKLVPGVALLPWSWAYPQLPQGMLFVYDIANTPDEGRVDWDSFGSRYFIAYEGVS